MRISVAGAGLIGRRHIEEIARCPDTSLASVVDPSPAGREVAAQYGVAAFGTLSEMLAVDRPDGVIVATPNQLHVAHGLECVAAGVPVIVEKPIGDSVAAAQELVAAAEAAGVALLTGHHRNYSPIIARTREIVASGRLGRIVAVVGTALFAKPAPYFEENGGWRRRPGGGPLLLNLIHEVNALQQILGDIVRVQATSSNAVRGFEVEDTSAMLFTFASGALGTFLLSDTAASARSWEQTSKENLSYAHADDEDCYHFTGTRGSLSVPTMRVRDYAGPPSWWEPFQTSVVDVQRSDPLAGQIAHFAAVIRGEVAPICSGRDGLAALRVVDAVIESAATGRPVDLV